MFEWTLLDGDWPLCFDAQDALVQRVPLQSWMVIGAAPRPTLDDKGAFHFIGRRRFLTLNEVHVWARPRNVLLIRPVPMAMVLQCNFEVNAGFAVVSIAERSTGAFWAGIPIPENATAMELHRRVRQFGLGTGLLTSCNQDVQLYVGHRRLRKDAGVLWRKAFATQPPKRRLTRKTNLGELRLERQVRAACF